MSNSSPLLTRRSALVAGAALPFAASLAAGAGPANSAAEMMGASMAPFSRFKLGDFEVTTLLAGSRTVTDDPQGIFGMNVDAETFQQVSAENFIPADQAQFFFTPTVINTGSELILFDTGLNAASITSVLGAAGYTPEQVDVVVLTHMHGDHIGGLMNEGAATFPNARYVANETEYKYWTGNENERVAANVTPLLEKMTFIGDGASPASGITSVAAFGHTPGHMGYMIESGGKGLMLTADLANHYVWSLAYPDWEVRFDIDKEAAAASRREMLGMIAADRIPMIGYHMPFPGMGFVDTRGDGFHYVPATYQMMLG
jgi:glyoxylase-like metal-dependent hydrolase (beta-lactamase superfamily II)